MKKEKICQQCGRAFEFRKKWEKNWDEIKFCSDRCRQSSKGAGKKLILHYKEKIVALLKSRSRENSACPSEILSNEEKSNKQTMENVRQAARLLADEGIIVITQAGRIVDPSDFRGPIRLKLKA